MSDANERMSLQYDHLHSQLQSVDRKNERTAENYEKLREKVQSIENKISVALGIAAALAAIFGIAGAVGYYILLGAQEKISKLRDEVESVNAKWISVRNEINKEVDQANAKIIAQGKTVIAEIQNAEGWISGQLQDAQAVLDKNVAASEKVLDGYIDKTLADLKSAQDSNISEIKTALELVQQKLEDSKGKEQKTEIMPAPTTSTFVFSRLIPYSLTGKEVLVLSNVGPFPHDAVATLAGTATQQIFSGIREVEINVRIDGPGLNSCSRIRKRVEYGAGAVSFHCVAQLYREKSYKVYITVSSEPDMIRESNLQGEMIITSKF
jgi:hypothetical protein